MCKRGSVGAAMAVVAASAGTAFASGRELTLFFALPGWAGWPGIAFAALAFGLLMGLLCRCAARYGASTFSSLCRRMLGPRAAAVAGGLHGLLLALTALAMLWDAGRLGALTLPLGFSFLWGAGAALLIALAVNLARLRPMPWIGAALAAVGVAFYAALALDPRPIRVYIPGEAVSALEGSLPAALLLALLYAAMNASVAAGVAARFARRAKPREMGLCCAIAMAAILLCYNAAVARGGRALLFQALPTVVLVARWGVAGFWLCAGFGFLCRTATLAAVLSGLTDRLVSPVEKRC